MALTKITSASLLTIVSTAPNAVTIGAAVDVSTYYGVDVKIRVGRGTGTAFTVPPIIRIEGSYLASPTANDWISLAEFSPALGASIGSTAVSGTEAAGQTVVSLTSATNFTAGDYIFFHNTTIANSEWSRIVSVATNDITIEEGLVFAQTGATARDQAEQFRATLDVTSIQKIRLVVNGAGSGQAVIVAAELAAVSGL